MHFQNERGLFADCARVISECCFVRCADFAQFRTTRFQDFPDPKTAANLNQFATRNNDFVGADSAPPFSEVANDQDQCRSAIVHHGG